MSYWPPFPRVRRLPFALLWMVMLVITALVTFSQPSSWAAPVARPATQTVPAQQQTHLPLITSSSIHSCEFNFDICRLNIDFVGGSIAYDWAPDGHTITFYGEADGSSGLYVVNEQGQDRRLLLDMSNIIFIRYSPDGTMIALTVSRPGSLSTSGPANGHIIHDLYVYMVATGQMRQLSDPGDEEFSDVAPHWSPDSSTLTFTRIRHDSATGDPTRGDIYTIRPDGSELTQLTDTPQSEHLPTYSPDGTHIAYISVKEGSNNPSIAVMEANGDEPAILTSDEALFANEPFWAPDSNSIFFFGATENYDWDIYRISIEGGDPINLTHDDLKQSHPVLSADGNRILFIGRVDTPEVFETDLYTMNIDGSNMTKYPNPHRRDEHPAALKWHPDGQRISYAVATDGLDLYLLRLEPEARR